jgi:hypothetical protein
MVRTGRAIPIGENQNDVYRLGAIAKQIQAVDCTYVHYRPLRQKSKKQ